MFARVSRRNPCPVCGHDSWCYLGERGVFCCRVPSEHPTRDGVAWFHPYSEGQETVSLARRERKKRTRRAPPDQRDRVYRALLSVLSLHGEHARELHGRGLEDLSPYRTLPRGGRERVAKKLEPLGLEGIPGFDRADEGWTLRGQPGILIPVRDLKGRILAFQIRTDSGNPKYAWLSGDVSSGAPVHVARRDGKVLIVTEGVLKADVTARYLPEAAVLGVPGVSAWRPVPAIVKRLRPGRVVVAYDADAEEKPAVLRERERLCEALSKEGFRTLIAVWPREAGKGLDDVLHAGRGKEVRIFAA